VAGTARMADTSKQWAAGDVSRPIQGANAW
jgi:hypothetical protein